MMPLMSDAPEIKEDQSDNLGRIRDYGEDIYTLEWTSEMELFAGKDTRMFKILVRGRTKEETQAFAQKIMKLWMRYLTEMRGGKDANGNFVLPEKYES